MRFTGHHMIDKTRLVEVVELPIEMHPWFVATQAHPEFKSRPNRPAPLYRDLHRRGDRASRNGSKAGKRNRGCQLGPRLNHRRRPHARRRAQSSLGPSRPASAASTSSCSTGFRRSLRCSSRARPARPVLQREWTEFRRGTPLRARRRANALGLDDRTRMKRSTTCLQDAIP